LSGWSISRRRAGLLAPAAARAGSRPVTQLEFARAGIVTEEMRYVAHRENLCRERAFNDAAARIADARALARRFPNS